MAKRRANPHPGASKRFSVTLDAKDYERLVRIAEDHKPRLTLQYVVQYAIQAFLDEVNTGESPARDMADPRRGRRVK